MTRAADRLLDRELSKTNRRVLLLGCLVAFQLLLHDAVMVANAHGAPHHSAPTALQGAHGAEQNGSAESPAEPERRTSSECGNWVWTTSVASGTTLLSVSKPGWHSLSASLPPASAWRMLADPLGPDPPDAADPSLYLSSGSRRALLQVYRV